MWWFKKVALTFKSQLSEMVVSVSLKLWCNLSLESLNHTLLPTFKHHNQLAITEIIDLTDFILVSFVFIEMIKKKLILLMGTRNFTRRESALHSEVEALQLAMENMLQHSICQSFGTNGKKLIAMLKEPHVWPSFATELERIETLQICFPDFNIIHVPRVCNQISDFLVKTTRSFHRKLHFIGYSIPV